MKKIRLYYNSTNGCSPSFLPLEFFDEEVWQVSNFYTFTNQYKAPKKMFMKWMINET